MSLLKVLGYRDARLLLAGETLSMFGDRAMLLVLAIWVKTLTGSNAAAGLAIFAVVAPSIAAPIAGLLVDRVRRRPLMIMTDLLTGAAVLGLLFVHDRRQLWLIYAVGIVYGISQLVFGSAQSALLTVLLPSALLGAANGAFQTVREGLRIVAPPAGAAMFAALGGSSVAMLDATSFGFSALFLFALRTREVRPLRPTGRWRKQLAAGIGHIWSTPALRQIVFAAAVSFLVIGFGETLGFAVNDQGLHRPPAFIGVLGALQGLGAVAGGLAAPFVLRRLGDGRLLGLGLLLFAVGDALLISGVLAPVLVGFAVAGCGISWAVVAFATAIQLRTPPALQGRAYSAADMLLGVPQTISIAVGAALSVLVNYLVLLVVMAALIAASGIYLLTRRSLRPN